MDGFEWKTRLKWMIWGKKTHYFRKHPYSIPRFHGCTKIQRHWVEIWCLSDIDNVHIDYHIQLFL